MAMAERPPEAKILLVDDDDELTAMLRDYLRAESFSVDIVPNGEGALPATLSGGHDLVILDVMLPGMNGVEVLRRVRKESMIPVIMLTAKGDGIDRVVGLELGADDYVSKPFYPRELVARIRAVLRRRHASEGKAKPPRLYKLGDMNIDVGARHATHAGTLIDLTASEFNLLVALVQSGDEVASKEDLSITVLGRRHEVYDRSVDVHISNLRQKLTITTQGFISIETIRSVGYRIRCIQ